MPENNPPPATPAPASTPAAPGPLNQAQLASITKTEEICRAAQKPDYLAQLAPAAGDAETDEDITAAKIDALLDQCTAARDLSGQAAQATTGKEVMTEEERAAKAALLEVIHFIQARARQKHHGANALLLRDYGIGTDLSSSRQLLEQWSGDIYNKTASDTLPKVNTAKRNELKAARQAYVDSQTGQTGAQSSASQLRASREDLLRKIIAGRMQIQFAADAEWPFTDPANHPIRMEFQLPASRPFVG